MAYGKLVFTPEEWREAAHKYRKELLKLPLLGCKDTLDFMTGRPGVRYKESVGTVGLDAQFAKEAQARGLMNLKGHRSVGGIRASLYNAQPMEGVKALADYMKEFEVKHHV